MTGHRFSLCAVLSGLLLVSAGWAAEKLPAFPGAEGFGAFTAGGRGGKVLLVTNLEDFSGPGKPIAGSLRAAIMANGPRTIVFRVSGIIPLRAPLKISEPYLTVAGQTAPGAGVCLKNFGLSINTHDVVLRHLRVRPGDELGPALRKQGKSFEPDGISINVPSRNVILDHCSVSWAIDECLSVSGAGITDVTVQWCIISESLHESFHAKGAHGYGSLLRANGNLSFHHNLYAHHSSRSPRPGTYGDGSVLLDFRNNVIHDSMGYSAKDPVRMNYVANYIQRPRRHVFQVGGEQTRLYVEGNHLVDGGERNRDPWELISGEQDVNRAKTPFLVSAVVTQSAHQAYEAIVASGGATLPRRDAVDARVIRQLQEKMGGLINSQSEVGGYPELHSEAAAPDADEDGLPDAWEKQHGLDPASAKDASGDSDGDGYTNVEEFLNATDPS
jgi:pectate lyase